MTKKVRDHRQMGLWLPESDWVRPASLPVIPTGAVVAIDTETKDEGLTNGVGPGWAHGSGYLSGVSYAWEKGADYLPVRDPETDNFPREKVDAWLRDLEKRCTLVFQNATYDLGWTGLRPTKRIHDTHAAAVLIDENKFDYGLDAICRDLGVPGKDEKKLREAAEAFGLDPKKEMWRLPAKYKAGYATQDAVATLGAHNRQRPMIQTQNLERAYELECRLIPHVRDMRARGIRIDVDRAEQLVKRYYILRDQVLKAIKPYVTTNHKRDVTIEDVRSPQWLVWQFEENGIEFKRNPATGNPIFDKDWLNAQEHPLCQLITSARKYEECATKFVSNYILGYMHLGRLHAEINQLRDASEDGGSKGTRSYRFSYGNPPLQQMIRPDPDRADPDHKDYVEGFVDVGTEIRGCVLAEEGEVVGAPDYSQQEYRWIVIKADELKLQGAAAAVEQYVKDEATDFHNMVRDMTGLTRKKAKDTNFAKAFGAGPGKFAEMTGMSVEEAKATMEQYDTKMPFVKLFAEKAKAVADERGYVILLNGYRARFDTWEASWLDKEEWSRGRREGQKMNPCSIGEAQMRRKDENHVWYKKKLRRADTRIASNRVIQGSAAVQTKMALLAQAEAGYLPMLQMHDELVHSVNSERYAKDIVEIMRTVVVRKVPFKVDAEFGHTWGDCKKGRVISQMLMEARGRA